MSNWLKERADEVRRAEKERKEEFDRKVLVATNLRSQLMPYWKELLGVLDRTVKDFNGEFPEANRKIDGFEQSADTFAIRRVAYPAVVVKGQLNQAGTVVQYAISQSPRKGANTVEKQASFSFTVADGEPCYLDPSLRCHDDVAKLLLDSFFEF